MGGGWSAADPRNLWTDRERPCPDCVIYGLYIKAVSRAERELYGWFKTALDEEEKKKTRRKEEKEEDYRGFIPGIYPVSTPYRY